MILTTATEHDLARRLQAALARLDEAEDALTRIDATFNGNPLKHMQAAEAAQTIASDYFAKWDSTADSASDGAT
jgi:hypothetical protein